MANHSPNPDNYVGKKTFAEAMADADAAQPTDADKVKDAARRAPDKGEAAKNGGGKDA